MDTTKQDNIIALTVLDKDSKPLMVLPFAHYHSLRAYWRKTGFKWDHYKLQRVKPADFNSLRTSAKLRAPDPGPMHRLLIGGERLMKGDEWYSESAERWIETATPDVVPDPALPYRRSTVGEGWRLLGVGETLARGDEYYAKFDEGDSWLPTVCEGLKIPPHPGNSGSPAYYRRRVAEPRRLPEPPEGYYRMSSIEIVDRSDIFHNGENWEPARVAGTSVGALVGMYARPLRGFNKQTPEGTAGKDAKHELITT